MNGSNKVGSCTRIRTSNSPRTSKLALTSPTGDYQVALRIL
ncbi:MAG: hypothetical protein QXW72_02910 [Conexivisphaerales archaeon]